MLNKWLKTLIIAAVAILGFSQSPFNIDGMAANAATALSRVKSVRYSAAGGVETITVNVDRYDSVHFFYLSEPGRFVVDVTGAGLPSGQRALDIARGSVVRIRYNMFEADTARFVVDLSREARFTVIEGKGFIKLEAFTGAGDSDTIISVPDEGSIFVNSPDGTAISSSLSPDTASSIETAGVAQGGGIPGAQPDLGPTQRPERTPRQNRNPAATAAPSVRGTPRIPVTATPTPAPTAEPVEIPPPIITKDEFRLDIVSGLRVVYSTKGGVNTCVVEALGGLAGKSTVIARDEAPRISILIPYGPRAGLLSSSTMFVNSDVLKSISISQPDADTLRIALDVRADVDVGTIKDNDNLMFTLTNKKIHNTGYYKNDERAFITLYQTALTSGGEPLNEFYTLDSKDGGKIWNVTFDNDRSFAGLGAAEINDNLLQSYAINRRGGKTTLTVTAKHAVRLVICTKQVDRVNLLETTVSVVRPAQANEKLIVIDAGHGGHDSGAVALSGRFEKDFNLDIAVKLKERLSQEAGLRVFMTRDGDYFVDLYERTRLANELNATLFISIHANASSSNPDAAGVETLYSHTADLAGQGRFDDMRFAEMTQRKLISVLRTIDRGIVERPNLVVLRMTKMPAILVETAFMTNSSDLLNLSRSAYRKNVANAIALSVGEALSIIGR